MVVGLGCGWVSGRERSKPSAEVDHNMVQYGNANQSTSLVSSPPTSSFSTTQSVPLRVK